MEKPWIYFQYIRASEHTAIEFTIVHTHTSATIIQVQLIDRRFLFHFKPFDMKQQRQESKQKKKKLNWNLSNYTYTERQRERKTIDTKWK